MLPGVSHGDVKIGGKTHDQFKFQMLTLVRSFKNIKCFAAKAITSRVLLIKPNYSTILHITMLRDCPVFQIRIQKSKETKNPFGKNLFCITEEEWI